MFSHRLVILLALPLASMVQAFGPATPVLSGSSAIISSSNHHQNNAAGLTMRIGHGDMQRRGKITTMLREVVVPGNPAATKEAIETEVMTEKTKAILETMNWKRRKAMLRKVRNLAYKYDVPVEVTFGMPQPRLEREAIEAKEAAVKREARKIHFDKVNADRDAAVAERRAREAGSEADKIKKAAIRETKRQEMLAEAEAKKAAVEAEAKAKYDASVANEADQAEAEAEAAQAANEAANKKNQESQEAGKEKE